MNPKMRSKFQQIVPYCLGLRTENPGLERQTWNPALRELVTSSTCRNKEATPERKQVVLYSLDSHMGPST